MTFAKRILIIFLPFVLGCFMSNYLRTVTAVLSPFIEGELSISAATMGLIVSSFFLCFALSQIPVGVFTDRYGPRRVQAALFYLAGIGSIIFGCAKGPLLLITGLVLIGLGVGGGLMIAFVANRIWFNKEDLPLLNSLVFGLGSIGAVISTTPSLVFVNATSWETVAITVGIATMLVATLILVLVPDPVRHSDHLTFKENFRGLKIILNDRYFWKVSPLVLTSIGSIMIMQSYWIFPWMNYVGNFSRKEISHLLLVIGVVLVFAPPTSSYIAVLFSRFKGNLEWAMGIGVAISILTQIAIVLRIWPQSSLLWGLYAFFSFVPLLGFTAISLHFPSEYAGRSSTGVNLVNFSGTFFLQCLFGLISRSSILASFCLMILFQIAALIWFCFGKVGRYG